MTLDALPITCDHCGYEMHGWSRAELVREGWRWHDAKRQRVIVVCPECTIRCEANRREAAA